MMSLSLGAWLAFGEAAGDQIKCRRAVLMLALGAAILAADNAGRALHLVPSGGVYWSGALVGYAILSLGGVALLIDTGNPATTWIRDCLSLRPVRYLGKISYGLYLYHYFILFLFDVAPYQTDHVGTTFGRAVAALIATFATAHLSFRYIETPLLQLKDRLRRDFASAPRLRESPSA